MKLSAGTMSLIKVVVAAVSLLLAVATIYATVSKQVGVNTQELSHHCKMIDQICAEQKTLRNKTLDTLGDVNRTVQKIAVAQAEIKTELKHLASRVERIDRPR